MAPRSGGLSEKETLVLVLMDGRYRASGILGQKEALYRCCRVATGNMATVSWPPTQCHTRVRAGEGNGCCCHLLGGPWRSGRRAQPAKRKATDELLTLVHRIEAIWEAMRRDSRRGWWYELE